MNNQTLLKLSFIISILGILLLLFLANTISPLKLKIKDISQQDLNQRVEIQGKIQSIKTYKENFQIITINDSKDKIDILIDNPLNITKNQSVVVIGRITEYKNNLQIQADKIKLP